MTGSELGFERRLLASMRAFHLQSKEEKKARLHAVMELSVELENVKKLSTFSVRLADVPLERIIEGDWEAAADYINAFTFVDEDPQIRAAAEPNWRGFVAILSKACEEAKKRELAEEKK